MAMGRSVYLAERTKGANAPFAGQTVSTTEPVTCAFCITKTKN